jgi:8-oxo-dGTP diphosphatase
VRPVESRAEWLAGLPKKRVAVAGIFVDPDRRVLVLERTYAEGWVLPGGVVEAGESLAAAFRREIHEELGLHRAPGRLLCVDWVAAGEADLDGLVVVFDGGTLSPGDISATAIPNSEISGYRFVRYAELAGQRTGRVQASLRSLDTNHVVYMESEAG